MLIIGSIRDMNLLLALLLLSSSSS